MKKYFDVEDQGKKKLRGDQHNLTGTSLKVALEWI